MEYSGATLEMPFLDEHGLVDIATIIQESQEMVSQAEVIKFRAGLDPAPRLLSEVKTELIAGGHSHPGTA